MDIKEININLIKNYERNAKKHDKRQIKNVAESIKQFGFVQPIVIDKDGVIIIGHCRYAAALMLKMPAVPCVRVETLTKEQVNKLRLLDNKLNESEWDKALLLEDIPTLDFTGFDIDWGLDFETEPEPGNISEAPADEITPRTARGDVWVLGRHRLICGDASDPTVIDKLMHGLKARLLLTDPPYGIKADKGFSGAGGFSGKGKPIPRRQYKDNWDSERPAADTLNYICGYAEKAIIFGGNFFADILPAGTHWLVWNKHNTMPTFSDAELAWTNIDRNSVKLYDFEWNGLIGKEKERFHPTQKPVGLFADIIRDYTGNNAIVADFYGGSGTTLIACEQTGRNAYVCELSEHYCDVIIQRWENLTGKTAVKEV